MCHLHDVSVVLSSQGVAVEMIVAEARCPDGAAVGVFSWSEWLRCHKWSWWCLWTSHSQHLPLVPAKHSAAPSNPHIQTLPTLGSSLPPRRIFQLSKDKKGPGPKPGDAARQVSFLKHPTLVSTQRWPKTDTDNRSLIYLYSSLSQSFPLLPACLLGGTSSRERHSTSWTRGSLSEKKIECVAGSRWKANRACIWI